MIDNNIHSGKIETLIQENAVESFTKWLAAIDRKLKELEDEEKLRLEDEEKVRTLAVYIFD
jgi:hypothetical protein